MAETRVGDLCEVGVQVFTLSMCVWLAAARREGQIWGGSSRVWRAAIDP